MCLCVCCMVLLDTEDVSVEMNNLQLELSSLIDLDDTTAVNDRYSVSLFHYFRLV